MKVMTIFGTRPEVIKLNLVVKLLDQHCEHITVHTGFNLEEDLSRSLFDELEVRKPDIHLEITSKTFGGQIGEVISKIDDVLEEQNPDRILILGGTVSAMSAIIASGRKIPVFQMEAGARCFDDRIPEETNRRIVDHASTVLMPYTSHGKYNLLREGIAPEKIFVTGNPIKEILDTFADNIEQSNILEGLSVKPFEYFVATLHRAENIESRERLASIFEGLADVAKKFGKNVLFAAHPQTAEKLQQYGIRPAGPNIRLLKSLGFFDFVKLQKSSLAVLTDSGTVEDECSILRIPNITLRAATERRETLECGSNILSGTGSDAIIRAVELAIAQPAAWTPPADYQVSNVSQTVSKIVLGFLHGSAS
ncbi:MAG: non-hydrolyzing UDP-N-acetylglucosamine 2-epimerase [Pyrinomonadaceae bacterium]